MTTPRNRHLKTEGLVLRSHRLGEADRVLELYTEQRGRVSAVAKGLRRPRSKFGGRLDLFSRATLLLYEGRNLFTVVEAQQMNAHEALRADEGRYRCAHIAAESLLKLSAHAGGPSRAYPLMVRFLEVACEAPGPAVPALSALVVAAELKLLSLAGYLPELHHCVMCGNPTLGEEAFFNIPAGGVCCAACGSGQLQVNTSSRTLFYTLLKSPFHTAITTPADPGCMQTLRRLIDETYAFHAGFSLRSTRRVGESRNAKTLDGC